MRRCSTEEINSVLKELNSKGKQEIFEGRGVPYEKLSDREFEVFSYFIFKRNKIEKSKLYDSIDLMQGIRERGRDCILYKAGEVAGIIQCKHTEKENRMDRTAVTEEIIKFALNCIKDTSLIPNKGDIDYYLVHSFGFKEAAQTLLNNFYLEVTKDTNELKKRTTKVITSNSTLLDLKYDSIHNQLLSILKRLNVIKCEKQDIDLMLNEAGDIINLFFKVKLVVEKKPSLPLTYELQEPQKNEILSIYNSCDFINKLDQISINMSEQVKAIKSYWSTLKTLELLSCVEYFDEETLLAYQSDLLTKYSNKYNIHCEKIEKGYSEEKIKSDSRIFYWEVMDQDPLAINGMIDNKIFFQNGMYQDIANTEKLPTWMLRRNDKGGMKSEDINDFL